MKYWARLIVLGIFAFFLLGVGVFAQSSNSCKWTGFENVDDNFGTGDFDGFDRLSKRFSSGLCSQGNPCDIECRARVPVGLDSKKELLEVQKNNSKSAIWNMGGFQNSGWHTVSANMTGENITCSPEKGVFCKDWNQKDGVCHFDYEARFKCCGGSCNLKKNSTNNNSCTWTRKFDRDRQSGSGDYETLNALKKENPGAICDNPCGVKCVAIVNGTAVDYRKTGENVTCSSDRGLVCRDSNQQDGSCDYNYRVSFRCCGGSCKPVNNSDNNNSCTWTKDFSKSYGPAGSGDFEDPDFIRKNLGNGEKLCQNPKSVNCTALVTPNETLNEQIANSPKGPIYDVSGYGNERKVVDYSETGEVVTCSPEKGVVCNNNQQPDGECDFDYRVSFECCKVPPYNPDEEICEKGLEEWETFGNDLGNTGYTNNTPPEDISYKYANFSTGNNREFDASSPVVANGYVYVGGHQEKKIYQLNASNVSQVVATYQTKNGTSSTPAVANGYVYVGSNEWRVYQLNASNISQEISNYSSLGRIGKSSPKVKGDYVYIGGHGGYVYQLDASDISNLVSKFHVGQGPSGSIGVPIAVGNGYVYAGSSNGTVYQLDASDISNKVSEFKKKGSVFESPPAVNEEFLYVGSFDGNVYQLNASNISQKISVFQGSPYYYFEASPSIGNGYVYIGNWDGKLYQLNASNISQKISHYNTGSLIEKSSAAVTDKYVYIGGWNSYIRQLNASNVSQQISKFYAGTHTMTSPAVANGFLYAADYGGDVYQLGKGDCSVSGTGFSSSTNSVDANGLGFNKENRNEAFRGSLEKKEGSQKIGGSEKILLGNSVDFRQNKLPFFERLKGVFVGRFALDF